MAAGISNLEISKCLGISEGTVKVHVKHTLKKLKFRSRVELAVWASEHGFKVKTARQVLSESAVIPKLN